MKSCLVLSFAIAAILSAQEYRSTLTGHVTDPSGASVPNADVIAVKSDTGSRFETHTSQDGFYTLPQLPPGTYQLSVEAPGFKKYLQSGITVGTDQRIGQDVHLDLGSSQQSVVVQADASLLETQSASSGQLITTREVENLPVNGRSPMSLAYLGFGVVSNESRDQERPYENAGLSNQVMGGAAAGANEMLLDGVPNIGTTGQSGLRVAYSPPLDAVTEVKVETLNVDAGYGRSGGGTIELTTKGGGNDFHGAAYEYNQTSALAATPFFTNMAGGSKTRFVQNNYGGTFSGPVSIPKVYNGHDKLFFFFAYEAWKDRQPNPVFVTVPTEAERGGDFSALLKLGKQYQLYDPATAKLSGSTITRTPFANNIVPLNRLNPVALNYLKLLPLPNVPGNSDGTNNFYKGLTTADNYETYVGRLDYNLSDRNKLTGDVHQSLWQQNSGQYFGLASAETAYRATWGAMVDDVETFTPTLVGDFRLGFTRYRPYYVQQSLGYDPTQLGFPSYIATNATVLQLPQMNFADGFTQIGGGHETNQPLNSYQLIGSLTKVLGGHTLKFGGEARRYQFSQVNWTGSSGTYYFDSTWVKASSSATGNPTGSSLAAFLLGLPSNSTSNGTSGYTFNAFSTQDSYYYAGFINDDWHARPNLTLNLGLRWEHSTPSVERYNRQSNGFDPTAPNAVTVPAEAAYAAVYAKNDSKYPLLVPVSAFTPVGGLYFATPHNRNSYNTPMDSFAPRFGLSWSPGWLHNTVIRAGTGIFYYPYPVVTQPQPGFTYTNPYVATNDNYLTPATTLSNPFPTGLVYPPGSSLGVNTSLGQSISFYNQNLLNEYSYRWDLDIQHEFAKNYLLEVGYTGNHSVHLATSQSLAALPAQYLSTLPYRDAATIGALTANVTNPFTGLLPGTSLNSTTTSVSNLLRPFPEFSGITENYVNNGSSYFEQLSVSVRKRLSNGLQFLVNFQHSRLMEKVSYLNNNPGAFNLEKRVSSYDRPNRLVLDETYDLPFGRGRTFLSNANGWVDGILGGWRIGAIYTFQSGAPLGWGNYIYYGGALDYDARNVNHAFDTTQFNTISSQQLLDNLRTFPTQFNNLRTDITNNWDVNVSKTFSIYERLKLMYRAEAFNLANRAQFSSPGTTPTSGTFGQIRSQSNLPRTIQMSLRLFF
jgi:hypothetical protein